MKSNIYKLFQYVVIILCLALISKIILQEKEIVKILFRLDFYKFLPAILFSMFITLFFSQLIYNTLLLTTDIKIDQRNWLYIFLNSQFLDTIPFAGFFYKALKLNKFNLDYKYFLYSYLFIFVFWIIIYLFFFTIDTEILAIVYKDIKYFYLSIVFLFLSLSLFFGIRLFKKILDRINLKQYIFVKIKDFVFFLNKNLTIKSTKVFLKYGVLIHIFEFILYIVIVDFLNIDISFKTIFLIFLINSIIDFFPITPKNIGFSELVSGSLLNLIGFNFTTGVLIKLFVRISSILSTTILFFLNNIFKNDKK